MIPIQLHDRPVIEKHLRQDPYLHLYALGDLDDFFWPYTTWYAHTRAGKVSALFMLYSGGGLPVVLALAGPGAALARLRALLEDSLPLLPRRFYTHLSPGLVDMLSGSYRAEPHGHFLKMGLSAPSHLDLVDTTAAIQLTPADGAELCRFYTEAYPGNWFDPRMLETGCYYGIRREEQLVSVAGIHVYSPRYRAAALGNITTHPAYRGQGLAKQVTARLCQELRKTVDYIGLNVRADNEPALAAYTRLGFRAVAEYDEFMFESGPEPQAGLPQNNS
jgi:ribosomal protein S18 acetylase RimI-like enzyme